MHRHIFIPKMISVSNLCKNQEINQTETLKHETIKMFHERETQEKLFRLYRIVYLFYLNPKK